MRKEPGSYAGGVAEGLGFPSREDGDVGLGISVIFGNTESSALPAKIAFRRRNFAVASH